MMTTDSALVVWIAPPSLSLPELFGFVLGSILAFLEHTVFFLVWIVFWWFAGFVRFWVIMWGFSPALVWCVLLPLVLRAWLWFCFRLGALLRELVFLWWRWFGRRFVLGWLLEVAAAWIFRGSRAPPSVQRAEEVTDPSLLLGQLAHGRGIAYAQAASVTHASVTAGGLTPSRLRRRSGWVKRLEGYLGGRPGVVGELVRGRWTPDLPSSKLPLTANAFLALFDGEAKLLGGGVLPTGLSEHEVFLVVETLDGRRVVSPVLFAKLSQYACFRPRTPELLAGLRARAREWFVEKGVADVASALVLPDTVEFAFSQTAPERLARDRLDEFLEPPSLPQ